MRFANEHETPLVSICLLTYNHEKWIKEAIESVLMQETDFPCEFIIAEDCSTDKTREVILSYAEKYPLRLILQKKNKGATQNLMDLLAAPKGKYVACFEGDDSWIDPLKLQKQVAIMENDENIVMCYANALINDTANPDSSVYFNPQSKPPQRMNKYDVITHCIVPTCTTIYRRTITSYPEWFRDAHAVAYFHFYLLSKYGDVYYQDETLALYNHHYNGLSRKTNLSRMLFNDALLNYKLIPYFDGDHQITKIVVDKNIAAISDLFHRQEYRLARQLFWKLPLGYLLRKPKTYPILLKSFAKTHFFTFLSKKEKRTVY